MSTKKNKRDDTFFGKFLLYFIAPPLLFKAFLANVFWLGVLAVTTGVGGLMMILLDNKERIYNYDTKNQENR